MDLPALSENHDFIVKECTRGGERKSLGSMFGVGEVSSAILY
jgi:hypothetical protein